MKKTLYSLVSVLLAMSVSAQTRTPATRTPSQSKDSRGLNKLVERVSTLDGREPHPYVATPVASSSTVKKSGEAPDAVDKYSKAGDIIAGSISAMIRAKRHLAKQAQITAAEDLKLTTLMLALNDGSQAFHKKLKASSTINQADIMKLLSGLESAVSDLNKNGVLEVENEDARDELSTFIGIMEAAIAIVR